jgi:hypothetical protein
MIREKGKIELGSFACRMCHTRVMPGGAILKGAQGNFPLTAAAAIDSVYHVPVEVAKVLNRAVYAAPWLQPDPTDRQLSLTADEMLAVQRAMPPGVMPRHGAGLFFPVQVPDLIGVKDRHYLDRTGLQQHRSPVDMMRYAAMNQDLNGHPQSGQWWSLKIRPTERLTRGRFQRTDRAIAQAPRTSNILSATKR